MIAELGGNFQKEGRMDRWSDRWTGRAREREIKVNPEVEDGKFSTFEIVYNCVFMSIYGMNQKDVYDLGLTPKYKRYFLRFH